MVLTIAQRKALKNIYVRSPDGAPNYLSFRRRVRNCGDNVMVQWCGMFLGVERDGETHS